ncbi:MAG: hypothetical protein HS116_05860 [Planctomycetes bacterium]|nr:hypothetical protein [Planctomycetota bacterium]
MKDIESSVANQVALVADPASTGTHNWGKPSAEPSCPTFVRDETRLLSIRANLNRQLVS